MSAASAGSLTKKIVEPGERCSNAQLNLFSSPYVDYSINRVVEDIAYPIVPIQAETKLIECFLEPSKFYIDCASIQVSYDLRIVREDGTDIPAIHPRAAKKHETALISQVPSTFQENNLHENGKGKKRKLPSSSHAGTFWIPDGKVLKKEKLVEKEKEEQDERRRRDRRKMLKRRAGDSESPLHELKRLKRELGPQVDYFEGVTFDNLSALMIFKDIDMKISGQSIQSCYANFNIQSYILTLLFYSEDARKSMLERALWADESSPANLDIGPPSNYRLRALLFALSSWVSVRTALPLSFHLQSRLLIPMTAFSYHFFLASTNQVLKCADQAITDFRFEIRNFKLHYNKVEVNESLALGIEKRLSGSPARYPLINLVTRDFIIPAGLQVYTIDDVFANVRIPSECYICFNTQAASLGTLRTSIINFQHFGLVDACFYIDSVRYPSQELGLSYGANPKRGAMNAFTKLWSNSDSYQDEGE